MMRFMKLCWDKQEKTFLGRRGRSWAEICGFFFVFYALLLSFFCGMLSFMFQTLSHYEPTLVGNKGYLTYPGLGMRPLLPTSSGFDYTSLIYFTNDIFDERTKMCVDNLKEALKPYKAAHQMKYMRYWKLCDMRVLADSKQPCAVEYNLLATPECSESNNFGYTEGKPCVLVRINKIFGWKPDPFIVADASMPKDLKKAVTDYRVDVPNGVNLIWLDCYGEDEFDRRNLGNWTQYIPRRGFPVSHFPYLNQHRYLQPAVFVKFHQIRPNIATKVHCRIYGKNVRYDWLAWEGSFHFELLYRKA